MYNRSILGVLVGIGLLASGCGQAADKVTSNSVSAAVENGCVVSRVNASRVLQVQGNNQQRHVQLSYNTTDNCTGQVISAGSGPAPVSVLTGSFSSGQMALNVDPATLRPPFAHTGVPEMINLIFVRSQDWSESSTAANTRTQRVPGPAKVTRSTRTTRSVPATIQGATMNADYRNTIGRIDFQEETSTTK